MHVGGALFSLIATLTPTEKRHFRIFAGRHVIGEQNNYIDLFDAIDRHDGAEGLDFLAVPTHEHLVSNFAYNAHYLYQLILRSLQAYTYEASPARKLRSMLDKIELLIARQLHELAEKMYRRLLKEAESIEEYAIMLQALQIKRQWISKLADNLIWKELPALHEKEDEVLRKMLNENEIIQCYTHVFLATQNKVNLNKADENAALREILARPIMQDEAFATTFNGRIAWQLIHGFTYSLQAQHARAEPYYRRLLQVWEAHPQQIALHQERYAMSIVDLLNCCHSLDKYQDFELHIATIRSLKKLPLPVENRINWIVTNLEVLFYINTLRLDTASDVVARWEQVLNQNQDFVNEVSILSYSFNIALLYFVKEDFRLALRWLNRILNHPRTLTRSDVQRFSRMFYLVLQIELGNMELLETELANTRRALKLSGINPLEKAILRLLSKLITRPIGDWRIYQTQFWEQLGAIAKTGTVVFGLQEMQIWVQSRLAGHTIADQLRQPTAN